MKTEQTENEGTLLSLVFVVVTSGLDLEQTPPESTFQTRRSLSTKFAALRVANLSISPRETQRLATADFQELSSNITGDRIFSR